VFVYDSGLEQPFTAGRYAMPTAMIEAAGGTNVMESVAASWTTVGWESVLAADPEVIIIVDYGAVTARQKIDFLTANPAFSDMSAVKNQRFVVLSYDEATPGIRNVAAIEKLARELHSDRLN
jgi:iron complex transport system substrate-binding protein